jgi:hypothetical protein
MDRALVSVAKSMEATSETVALKLRGVSYEFRIHRRLYSKALNDATILLGPYLADVDEKPHASSPVTARRHLHTRRR